MGSVHVSSTMLPLGEAPQRMLDLYRYWSSRRPTIGSLPTWRDLDLLEMRPWLGRLSLYEACGDGDVSVRVRGTLKTSYGGEARPGFRISTAKPEAYARVVLPQLVHALTDGEPTRHIVELTLDGFEYRFDRLALPLAGANGGPPRLLTFVEFDIRRANEFWQRYHGIAGSPADSERPA